MGIALTVVQDLKMSIHLMHNGILRGAVAPAPVGLPYVLHDSVNIVMYPAAEIVALSYKLAKFYGVTADYLLGLNETRNHPNADLADLRLSDDMIELLKSGRIDTALLCELAAHPDFVKLLADIQIYVEGIAATQIQNLNAWVDVARAEIVEKYQPGEHDKTAGVLQAAHVREGDYFSSPSCSSVSPRSTRRSFRRSCIVKAKLSLLALPPR